MTVWELRHVLENSVPAWALFVPVAIVLAVCGAILIRERRRTPKWARRV